MTKQLSHNQTDCGIIVVIQFCNQLTSIVFCMYNFRQLFYCRSLKLCLLQLPEGTTNFVYDGNKLITELAPTHRLDFLYDENGLLYGFVKDSTNVYYYVKDYLQNILGIVDINGKLIVKYNQTAYGIVTIALDTNDIGKINPFRYKGYYYDQESGMYYCHTRYFVPEWGRWLNADNKQHLGELKRIFNNIVCEECKQLCVQRLQILNQILGTQHS